VAVACLYDIHGNLPALEAVLADPALGAAERVLVGGDVVAGPMPVEVLERIDALGSRAVCIRGNADREPGDHAAGRLGPRRTREVAEWPETAVLDVEGLGEVLFCHGSPRSDEEILTAASPPERIHPALEGVSQRVVVCGHTHVQFDRVVDGTRIVNAGSVGMPYQSAPGFAFWCLLGPEVELRRSGFDPSAAAELIAACGMPGASAWADEYVLAQHSAREATEFFEEMAAGRR
jgi:putative phosphoesterase